ncbi:MAG TPA: phosphoribosylglycinamide formyltransferase [Casimicrobiaceae bacterium]|jgi:phosphoribosylglycinamide formyltransferase-1
MKRLVIVISGRGSNMAAILDAERAATISGRVVGVISNRPDAAGLAIAARNGVPTAIVDHLAFPDRNAFDHGLSAAIDAFVPDLVVLAGFMRVLGTDLVARYSGRLLNIHPSLLPAYPGLNTHRRALADGVKVHGCTAHFVTSQVDHGPIVAQGAVAVRDDDDETTLAARVLSAEHRVLVAAVRWFCDDRLVIEGKRVRVKNETTGTDAQLVPELPPLP